MRYLENMNTNMIYILIATILIEINAWESMQYPYRNQVLDKPLKQTNLLFIIFDDLRTELSVYGKKHMITPNFERLAKKSVTFENAYSQVAVCNPSRDSLLTGLRPDTMGTYGFQSTHRPFLLLPTHLARSGYNTAGYGKIRHYESNDKEVWNYDAYDGKWYDYQYQEWLSMNSSVMPDKNQDETLFRDYTFATKAIESIEALSKLDDPFMVAIGFKMPHLCLHVPYRTFDLYRNMTSTWESKTQDYLSHPPTVPLTEYRCCGEDSFRFMEDEGTKKHTRTERVENILRMSPAAHKELMWGYAASITFVDEQVGRVLDALDRLMLWDNITIVLTADHGMHNGEKGTWEKWTLFDESTKVPLMIYHPDSPFKGQMVHNPVELVDLYPTIIDLLVVPYDHKNIYSAPKAKYVRRYQPLEGRSLAPMLLGKNYFGGNNDSMIMASTSSSLKIAGGDLTTPESNDLIATCTDINKCGYLMKSFAVSQMWKCAKKYLFEVDARKVFLNPGIRMWADCDFNNLNNNAELSLMGYSMRTVDYRYTAWIPIDRKLMIPEWNKMLYAEELYDHRREKLGDDYIHELINVAPRIEYRKILRYFRERLIKFFQEKIIYRQRDSNSRKSVLASMELALSTGDGSMSATAMTSGGLQRNIRKQLLNSWSSIEHDVDGTNKLVNPQFYQ